ncbi:MAG: hypothetical protein GY856_35955 [bacterium]|nr:hypothetical protein [bacterium]
MRRSVRGRRGHALIVALFVIIVLMTAAALVASSLAYRMWSFRQETQAVRLTALLDGALAKALANLWSNPGYGGVPAESFGDGTITIEVRPADLTTVEVVVKASYWGGRRAARAVVRLDKNYPPAFSPEVKVWEPVSFEY